MIRVDAANVGGLMDPIALLLACVLLAGPLGAWWIYNDPCWTDRIN